MLNYTKAKCVTLPGCLYKYHSKETRREDFFRLHEVNFHPTAIPFSHQHFVEADYGVAYALA